MYVNVPFALTVTAPCAGSLALAAVNASPSGSSSLPSTDEPFSTASSATDPESSVATGGRSSRFTAALATWPSGLVNVTSHGAPVAAVVSSVSDAWLGLVTVTAVTSTPQPAPTCGRLNPGPGSKKPRPSLVVPVSVTEADDWPVSARGDTDAGTAGPGARSCAIRVPQLLVAATCSWIVHIVMSSAGSRLTAE